MTWWGRWYICMYFQKGKYTGTSFSQRAGWCDQMPIEQKVEDRD
jgi:hypothetical protein